MTLNCKILWTADALTTTTIPFCDCTGSDRATELLLDRSGQHVTRALAVRWSPPTTPEELRDDELGCERLHRAATQVVDRAAVEAPESGDGYAAQEVMRHAVITEAISDDARAALAQVVKVAGLTRNALTGRLPNRLRDAVDLAVHAVRPDL